MAQLHYPQAQRPKTKADIVFCIDRTGSMQPCIDGVKASVTKFAAESLQSYANVDYRLRLIAFRDLPVGEPLEEYEFGKPLDHETFRSQVASLLADGGGPEPESALDAIYVAALSDWREKCHRAIVVLTDATCYPDLHESTRRHKGLSDGDMNHVMNLIIAEGIQLVIVGPDFPVYHKLDAQIDGAIYKKLSNPHAELQKANLAELLDFVGKSISTGSVSTQAFVDSRDEEI